MYKFCRVFILLVFKSLLKNTHDIPMRDELDEHIFFCDIVFNKPDEK